MKYASGNECLNGRDVLAFGRDAHQRLELILPQFAELLEKSEIVLRSWRGGNRNDPDILSSRAVDLARPCSFRRVVLNRKNRLRPHVACRLVLHKQPYLMVLGQSFQRSPDGIPDSSSPLPFSIGERFLRSRVRDLNALSYPNPECKPNQSHDGRRDKAFNDSRCHSFLGYCGAAPLRFLLPVIAASSPSRKPSHKSASTPSQLPRCSALVQPGPFRRGLLVRRFPQRGAVNNRRRI